MTNPDENKNGSKKKGIDVEVIDLATGESHIEHHSDEEMKEATQNMIRDMFRRGDIRFVD